jgi:hypothetical protein
LYDPTEVNMHHVPRFPAVAALFLVALIGGKCLGDPPPPAPGWVQDPANSQWIDLAEKAESHGLVQLPLTSEGMVQPTRRGARACWEAVAAPGQKRGARCWYFQVGPWTQWAAWIGEDGVQITFVYFDGQPGKIPFSTTALMRPLAQTWPGLGRGAKRKRCPTA